MKKYLLADILGLIFLLLARTFNCQKTLNVCSVIESGNDMLVYNHQRAGAAIDMAMEYANEVILPSDVKLRRYYKDGGKICGANNVAVRRALEWINEGIDCNVYIGPGCDRSVADLYMIASYIGIPLLGVPASNVIGDTKLTRTQLPLLIRPAYSFTDVSKLVIKFLDTFGYRHTFSLVDESNNFYQELGEMLDQEFRLVRTDLYKNGKTAYFKSEEETEDRYRVWLQEANTTARVILLFANAATVRNIMLVAEKIGMTDGNYVYIGVELYKSAYWGEFTWRFNDRNDREAGKAYRSLALIGLYENHDQYFDEFQKEVRRRARLSYNYTYQAYEQVDPVVTSFHDAFIAYAGAVRTTFQLGGNMSDGLQMAAAMKNSSTLSPLGYRINLDSRGDRSRSFSIKDLNADTGRFEDVLKIDYRTNEEVWFGNFTWPGHPGLPLDVPLCGFDGMAPVCHPVRGLDSGSIAGIAIGAVAAFLLLAVGLLVTFLRKNSVHGMDPYWWRIRTDELQMLNTKLARSMASMNGMRLNMDQKLGSRSMVSIRDSTATTKADSTGYGLPAVYEGNTISLTEITPLKHYRPSNLLLEEMNTLRLMSHQNLHRFVGICLDEQGFCEFKAGELCTKGTLDDVLEDERIKLDWPFKYSMIRDITQGMTYLHASPVGSHGHLTAHNCVVDSRFVVKVANYGLSFFGDPKDLLPPIQSDETRDFKELLWRAPELMRQIIPYHGSQKGTGKWLRRPRLFPDWPVVGDVYSYAIILQQIILRSGPYQSIMEIGSEKSLTYKEIVLEVKQENIPPLRPKVPKAACSEDLFLLMERCWSEYPIERPSFVKIRDSLKKVIGSDNTNLVDHLLHRMEQYANSLEEQVAEKTHQFMEEKRRSEELLSQLLPKTVAAALTKGETIQPESFESVTLYFSDIVEFTNLSASITPMDVVTLLNSLYSLFDAILERYDVYKVETIGDAYMVASGLPIRNGHKHAKEIASVALQIRRDIASFVITSKPNEKLRTRIGIHSGSCVAGVVGLKMPRYCLFGDTVNTASRMETTGEPMKIHLTNQCKVLLENIGGFVIQERGQIAVKGKGQMTTYWLVDSVGQPN